MITSNKRMVVGTKLIPVRQGVESCIIIDTPLPPKLWAVRYQSGKERRWSKSHLRKYYIASQSEYPVEKDIHSIVNKNLLPE